MGRALEAAAPAMLSTRRARLGLCCAAVQQRRRTRTAFIAKDERQEQRQNKEAEKRAADEHPMPLAQPLTLLERWWDGRERWLPADHSRVLSRRHRRRRRIRRRVRARWWVGAWWMGRRPRCALWRRVSARRRQRRRARRPRGPDFIGARGGASTTRGDVSYATGAV